LTEQASSKNNQLQKLLAIAAFLSFTASIGIIWANSPASGYEISIFTSLPLSAWILLFFSLAVGIILIVYQSSTRGSTMWIYGGILLLLFNITILTLQFMRGYFLYGVADPFAHLATTDVIVSTGYVKDNYYPAINILAAAITYVTDIPSIDTTRFLPPVFTLFFMIFTFFLTFSVSHDRRSAILSVAAATPLLFAYFHLTPYPHALAIFLFPLLFFIYFRNQKFPSRAGSILLIITIIFYVFLHPLIVMVLISALFVAEGAKWIWKSRVSQVRTPLTTNPALIALCSFFLWFAYFTGSGIPAQRITQRLAQETVTTIKRSQELEPVFQLDLPHFIELTIKMYGHLAIFLVCAGAACCLALLYFKRRENQYRDMFLFAAIFVGSMASYMVVGNRTGLVTMGRLFSANAGIWATPVLASIVFTWIIHTKGEGTRRYYSAAVILILICASFLGVMSSYRSPWIYQQNWQVSYRDIAGTNWYGASSVEGRFDYEPMGYGARYKDPLFPRHFGYTAHQFAGESLYRDAYVVITQRFKVATEDPALQFYMNVPWYMGRKGFDLADFARFQNDRTTDWIYSNGEFDLFISRITGVER